MSHSLKAEKNLKFYKQSLECDKKSKAPLEVKSVNMQMKSSDTGGQSEFISVQSGGDCEMKPASVFPHRMRLRIISAISLIIIPNRRCHTTVEQLDPMGVLACIRHGRLKRRTGGEAPAAFKRGLEGEKEDEAYCLKKVQV